MYGLGGIVPPDVSNEEKQPIQCFPLYSFLLALENPRVNLLVLDIEGAEYEVSVSPVERRSSNVVIIRSFQTIFKLISYGLSL